MLKAEEEAIDASIKKLQGYKDNWDNVANAHQNAQDRIAAAQQIGADWESQILSGRLNTLENFKANYIRIQEDLVAKLDEITAKQSEIAAKALEIEAISKRISQANNNTSGSGGSGGGSSGNNQVPDRITYEQWLKNNPEPVQPTFGGQPDSIWKIITDKYKSKKYAWDSAKRFAGFAKGTLSAPEGWANVHEGSSEGRPEIIIPKPQSGSMRYMEYGDAVIPADISKRLMDMAMSRPAPQHLTDFQNRMASLSAITSPNIKDLESGQATNFYINTVKLDNVNSPDKLIDELLLIAKNR